MSQAEKQTPHVETQIGRELLDIYAAGRFAGMSDSQIHAAMLGRTGINATAWGDPNRRDQRLDHSDKSSGAASGDQS